MTLKFEKPGKPKSQKERHQERVKALTKPLKKADREKVYQKYNGRCAYCGNGIDQTNFQVDHLIPKARIHHAEHESANWWDNLMPSCRRCNHYKRAMTLEQYRNQLKTIQDRISKDYLVKVAIDYGVIEFHIFDGEFYFEKVKRGKF